MKAEEYMAALAAGTAKGSDLFEHFRLGHFTPDDYNAAIVAGELPKLQAREEGFYAGRLFRAQNCIFAEWCDGLDLHQDRRRAEEYSNLERATGRSNPEIQLFIRLMVKMRRVPMMELEKDPVLAANINTKWISNIDRYKWRHWPKKKDLELFQLPPTPAGAKP